MVWHHALLGSLVVAGAAATAQPSSGHESSYFEGRWAFVDESCDVPTNWTMIAGGNFVSENLTGIWEVDENKLVLSLNDLAVDEETGEQGGRFRMEGAVTIIDRNRFDFAITPDTYRLKRCP